jgi:hypothetical protein
MRPSVQWFATPAKLSTVAPGTRRELRLGVAELLGPRAAGGEDEVLLGVGGDVGVGLADLVAQDVDVDGRLGRGHATVATS